MKKSIFIISIFVCFTSCNYRVNDYGGYALSENPEYGEDLVLMHSDTSTYHQWEDGSRTLQKGVFLKYIFNNKIDTLFVWEGSTIIEAYINDINSDNVFIIVDQKPLDSIWGPIVNVDLAPKRQKQFDNAREAEYYFRTSNIHNFWIVNKDLKEVYGPMQKDVYEKKRKELKIPQHLTFKATFRQ